MVSTEAQLLHNTAHSRTHPKYAQHLADHASIQLTLDRYSHWMPSMGRNTADGMDQALGQVFSLGGPCDVASGSASGRLRSSTGGPRSVFRYIERLTEPGMTQALKGRGGVCARVIENGTVRVVGEIDLL